MQGTSLVGQRLKLHAPNARDLVTTLGHGIRVRIP